MKTKINLLKSAMLIVAIIIISSCHPINSGTSIMNNNSSIERVSIVTIDSCEYIQFYTYAHYAITHKGNCKFCAERTKKPLK